MRAVLAGIVLALSSGPALTAPPPDPAAAAKAWVGLIDQGRYAQSWSEAGSIFRTHVTRARWARMVAAVRGPMGPMTSRNLTSDQRSDTLPGAPDGAYATLRFATAFAHKRQATETIALSREASGWRVDGYFIR
jgi:hypothetical protein